MISGHRQRFGATGRPTVRIIDSHFHCGRPRAVLDALCHRQGFPRAVRNTKGGYTYWRKEGGNARFNWSSEWFDLEESFAHMDALGHQVEMVNSAGPFSLHFCDLPVAEAHDAALQWNEEMAAKQRKHAGRFWSSAVVPLADTRTAIEVLDQAVGKLGLIGASLPASIAPDFTVDAPQLEPFYARAEELGAPLFMHPTDAVLADVLEGYGDLMHESLGRALEVSVAALRLILSGIMERHPRLKIVMSHTGGVLPYQAGRLDKNTRKAKLSQPVSAYMKRMYTDTVSPHGPGIKFAIEFYGVDNVMYGTDHPCWDPATAIRLVEELHLPPADQDKIFYGNARRILGLTRGAGDVRRCPRTRAGRRTDIRCRGSTVGFDSDGGRRWFRPP
jgi:aminocarboxymuconate-semialdehyde decarboxylase